MREGSRAKAHFERSIISFNHTIKETAEDETRNIACSAGGQEAFAEDPSKSLVCYLKSAKSNKHVVALHYVGIGILSFSKQNR